MFTYCRHKKKTYNRNVNQMYNIYTQQKYHSMDVIVIGISWYLRWNISWVLFCCYYCWCQLFAFAIGLFQHNTYATLFPSIMHSRMWWQYQSWLQISNNVASSCDSVCRFPCSAFRPSSGMCERSYLYRAFFPLLWFDHGAQQLNAMPN